MESRRLNSTNALPPPGQIWSNNSSSLRKRLPRIHGDDFAPMNTDGPSHMHAIFLVDLLSTPFIILQLV